MESDITTLSKLIATKENTSAVVTRMQSIHESLNTKADVKWCKESLGGRTAALEQTTATYQQIESNVAKLLGVVTEHTDAMRAVREKTEKAVAAVSGLTSKCDGIATAVNASVDRDQLDAALKNVSRACEVLIDRVAQKSVSDHKHNSAQTAELLARINQLKAYQLSIDKKCDIAIRFVNWFTDSKLDQSSAGVDPTAFQ